MLKAVTFDFWETLVQDSAENLRRQRRARTIFRQMRHKT